MSSALLSSNYEAYSCELSSVVVFVSQMQSEDTAPLFAGTGIDAVDGLEWPFLCIGRSTLLGMCAW